VKGPEPWRGPLARLRQCLSATGRRRHGCFTLEGLRLVERALRADIGLSLVVAAEQVARTADPRQRALLEEVRGRAGIELHLAPDEEIDRFTEGRAYGPFLGLAPIRKPPPLRDCLAGEPPSVVLVALDVQDPGNVGALSPTALTLGAKALVAVGLSAPHHPKAVRTSMGRVFRLPVLGYPEVPPLLEELRALNITTAGAVSGGGVSPSEVESSGRLALFLGSEAFGLPEEIVTSLDHRVTIPMATEVDSLSVNAAAAILLYELLGRRAR